jgi:hypothetical protein
MLTGSLRQQTNIYNIEEDLKTEYYGSFVVKISVSSPYTYKPPRYSNAVT